MLLSKQLRVLLLVKAVALACLGLVACASTRGCEGSPSLTAPHAGTLKDRLASGLPETMGPPADLAGDAPATFEEGKAAAAQDFRRTVRATFGTIIWISLAGIAGSLALAGLSLFFPWASIRAALIGLGLSLAAVVLSIALRYVLLVYGVLTLDILVWVALGTGVVMGLAFAVPFAVSWFRRHVRNTSGAELAAKAAKTSDPAEALRLGREATAVLSLVDRAANKARKRLPAAFTMPESSVASEARLLGVKLPTVVGGGAA